MTIDAFEEESARRPAVGRDSAGASVRIRLIATTDLHAQILPHDYYADRPAAIGLALAARLIRRLRAEALEAGVAVLLLDNGDHLQGSMLSDWLASRSGEGGAGGAGLGGAGQGDPVIAAMNALGYDAGTLGNHEFNYGLPYLRRALAGARFPVVAANVHAIDGMPLAPPWAILERLARDSDGRSHLLRIGVIGLAPPQIALWDRLILAGSVRTTDIVEAARAELPRMRSAGADLVVVLCHAGIGAEAAEPGMENAALPLAALPGIDALVVGHTHLVFPGQRWAATAALDPVAGTLHGRPAVQPGAYGSHVGVIDLALARADGRWQVASHEVRAVQVTLPGTAPDSFRADPAVARVASRLHARLLREARQAVGRTEVPLQSYFSLVAADAALDVVADAVRAQAARLVAGTAAAGLPILAAVAPFRAGGPAGPGNYIDIAPGPIELRQAAELYIHPNGLCVVEITGRGLLDWLERSASIFRVLAPGVADQPLIDPDHPSYNFDMIDGLTYAIDPTRAPRTDAEGRVVRPDAARVSDLRHAGRPVAPGDRFALATNSHRMGEGGRFLAAAEARMVAQSPRHLRDVVLAHVRAGPVRPAPRDRWRFAARPGTAAWFDSGPGALAHLGSVEGRDVAPLGPAPRGFMRFLLRL